MRRLGWGRLTLFTDKKTFKWRALDGEECEPYGCINK